MSIARSSNGYGNAPARSPVESIADDGAEVLDLRGQPSALESVTRAEVDTQIATAKRYPRSIEKFMRKAQQMVGLPGIAEQCRYVLPARKGGGGGKSTPISGPSVRLAEIVVACWGNLRVAGRIVDDDGKFITAQGVAMDLEENIAYSVEVKRRVTTKDGYRFGDDMYQVTCNAAYAIATRNATFKVVPRAFVAQLEEVAMLTLSGDLKTFPERVDKALAWCASKGVTEGDVYRTLGIFGRNDFGMDHLLALQGFRTAILDGQATVAEIFFPVPDAASGASAASTRTDDLKSRLGLPEASPLPAAAVIPERRPEPASAPEPSFREGTSGTIRSEADDDMPFPLKPKSKTKPNAPEVLPREPGSDG